MADQLPAAPTSDSTITPTNAVRVARIGGTIAELAAAAISAHTLYHLGGQLSLGPAAAWLLPAALDVYAFTALAVGYNLPADHPGQKPVLRNARLAFAMTLGCNALDHLLQKAGRLVDPTIRDLLLVGVATLPPLVVERLLNLQSLLVGHRGQSTAVVQDPVSAVAHRSQDVGEDTLAHEPDTTTVTDPSAPSRTDCDTVARGRPDWTAHGRDVFTDLADHLRRRPTGREFQAALATYVRAITADGRFPAGTRPPSVTSAKRIRATLEAEHARVSNTEQLPKTVVAVADLFVG
jgi:hypothetical protein